MTHQAKTGESSELSNDDKLISLICHLSAAFGSIVLPAIVYFIYRKRSKFVSFNALQALYYQVAFLILTFVITFILTIILLSSGFEPSSPVGKQLVALGISLLVWALELSYAVFIGVRTFKGEIIMYYIFGEFAYDKVYSNSFKESFNLTRKNKSHNTYNDTPPPGTGQGKGLI